MPASSHRGGCRDPPPELGATQRAIFSTLEDQLATLRRQRAQLELWQEQSAAESARKRKLWELAELAAVRLGKMTPQEKAAVLNRWKCAS